MLKMARTGHHHADTEFVGFSNTIIIANRATGLYDCRNAILSSQCNGIIKWQETIRCQNQPICITGGLSLLESNLC